MTREEFAGLLRTKGYDAAYENGEVVVYGINKKLFRVVESIAKTVGYYGPYNWSGKEKHAES